MLNPQRWGGTGNSSKGGGGVSASGWGVGANPTIAKSGFDKLDEKDDDTLFEVGDADDDDPYDEKDKAGTEDHEEDPWAEKEKEKVVKPVCSCLAILLHCFVN